MKNDKSAELHTAQDIAPGSPTTPSDRRWEEIAGDLDRRIASALLVLRSHMSKSQKVKSAIGVLSGEWVVVRR